MMNFSKDPLLRKEGIFYFLLCLFIASGSFAQPRLTIPETKKNFGEVSKGQVVRNVYEFKNTGNEPLILDYPEIPCSCTSIDYPEQPILPQQTGTIVIIFDTKSAYGKQDRTLMMESNDPRGAIKLRWKGNVLTNEKH